MANSENMKNSMSMKDFSEILHRQKRLAISRWSELEENQVYRIDSYKRIPTKNGNTAIVRVNDMLEVWCPPHIANRLDTINEKNWPVYLISKGKVKSKTSGNMYWDFDLVYTKSE